VTIERDFWRGRRVLLTGHTGFKGAWLSLWLQSLGAELTGLASGVPTQPSLYELASVGAQMDELDGDLRDPRTVREALRACEPEVVLHLAAQPLVRRSLREPLLTYEVNVIGTLNVLDAVRDLARAVRCVVVVTSDKCYANPGDASHRLREGDPLGGEDPYSSSKACAELLTAAYRRSFFATEGSPALATARAGNVIGGGDWGAERLVPDAMRAVAEGAPLRVRNPDAVRPWQHVLSPLRGYLQLAQELCASRDAARAWNFGPRAEDERPVGWIVQTLSRLLAGELRWEVDEDAHPPEAMRLSLDSSDAERRLGWHPACGLEQALALVVEWHRAHREGSDMRAASLAQIAQLG
jgi:CDP-glucose 4,6-dehydratase